jgi:hypothetical protein
MYLPIQRLPLLSPLFTLAEGLKQAPIFSLALNLGKR